MPILAPSILSADFTNLSQQIRLVEMGGADWIHQKLSAVGEVL